MQATCLCLKMALVEKMQEFSRMWQFFKELFNVSSNHRLNCPNNFDGYVQVLNNLNDACLKTENFTRFHLFQGFVRLRAASLFLKNCQEKCETSVGA